MASVTLCNTIPRPLMYGGVMDDLLLHGHSELTYLIHSNDLEYVRDWVNELMRLHKDFPYISGVGSLQHDARTEWMESNERLVDVEVWCDRHLDDERLVQLSGAVRRARQH